MKMNSLRMMLTVLVDLFEADLCLICIVHTIQALSRELPKGTSCHEKYMFIHTPIILSYFTFTMVSVH